jgi:uncharacterized protein
MGRPQLLTKSSTMPNEQDPFSASDLVAIDRAFKQGDLEALKAALRDPPDFPDCRGPRAVGQIPLQYAIYHSPLPFVRKLLELGADANYQDPGGFPCLIAALSTSRADRCEVIELLLSFSADIQQRGLNGYTPLHYAVNRNDPKAVELLLSRGADPNARTGIDNFSTPLQEAEILGHGNSEAAHALRRWTSK